jgi:hypothetical protein
MSGSFNAGMRGLIIPLQAPQRKSRAPCCSMSMKAIRRLWMSAACSRLRSCFETGRARRVKRRSKRHLGKTLRRSVVDVRIVVACTMRLQLDHAIRKQARDLRSDAGLLLPTVLMAGRLFARSQRFTMEMPRGNGYCEVVQLDQRLWVHQA